MLSCYILAAGGQSYLVTQRLFCEQHKKTLVRSENVTFGVWDNKFPIIGHTPMCQLKLETLPRYPAIGTFYVLLPQLPNSWTLRYQYYISGKGRLTASAPLLMTVWSSAARAGLISRLLMARRRREAAARGCGRGRRTRRRVGGGWPRRTRRTRPRQTGTPPSWSGTILTCCAHSHNNNNI